MVDDDKNKNSDENSFEDENFDDFDDADLNESEFEDFEDLDDLNGESFEEFSNAESVAPEDSFEAFDAEVDAQEAPLVEEPEDDFDILEGDYNDDVDETAASVSASDSEKTFMQKHFNHMLIGLGVLLTVIVFYFKFLAGGDEQRVPDYALSAQTQVEQGAPDFSGNDNQVDTNTFDELFSEDVEPENTAPVLGEKTSTEAPEQGGLFNAPDQFDPFGEEVTSLPPPPSDFPPQPSPLAPIEDESDIDVVEEQEVQPEQQLATAVNEPVSDLELFRKATNADTVKKDALTPLPSLPLAAVQEVDVETLEEPQTPVIAPVIDENMVPKAELEALQDDLQEKSEESIQKQRVIEDLRRELAQTKAALETAKNAEPEIKIVEKVVEKVKLVEKPAKVAVKQVKKEPPKLRKSYELRGAQSGQAYISAKGSSDMESVSVGDNHKDLGKITFIGQADGQWVVIGSNGRITQ